MKDNFKKIKAYLIKFMENLIHEVSSFSTEHIFEYLHHKFPRVKWIHVIFYYYKDHCPMRAAALSFYVITYMVSGIFLVIFISQLFDLHFAEEVIETIIKTILPAQIGGTTDFIIGFTKEVMENKAYIYIASAIAIYNMYIILIEIKHNFDEILDHYYTKSGGTFFRNQIIKIFSLFLFIIFFHFFIQPMMNIASEFTYGALVTKYAFTWVILIMLYNHSSNRIPLKLSAKGALISTVLLFIFEIVIFKMIASNHTFFGANRHGGNSIAMVFLFPFWVYIAWNTIFIGLEYIATFTRSNDNRYSVIYKQFVEISVLEMLYRHNEVLSSHVCKKFSIDYRYYQEQILHYFIRDGLVTYDSKFDRIVGKEQWYTYPITKFFKLNLFLVRIKDTHFIDVFHSLNKDEQDLITFEKLFELRIKSMSNDEYVQEQSLFEKVKEASTDILNKLNQ